MIKNHHNHEPDVPEADTADDDFHRAGAGGVLRILFHHLMDMVKQGHIVCVEIESVDKTIEGVPLWACNMR